MPRAQRRHPWEEIAEEVVRFMDEEPPIVAEAFRYEGRAPWAANVSEDEKLLFFGAQVFHPDGSPNQEGRARLMEQYGPDNYAAIMAAVLDRGPAVAAVPDDATMPAAGADVLP